MAPTYLLQEFKLSSDFHTHNTRNEEQVRLPLAKATNTKDHLDTTEQIYGTHYHLA